MKNSSLTLVILTIIICLFPLSGYGKTGYVSDMLLLTFRQGPGNSYAVQKTLISNTAVNILEEKNGFYKVKLQSNEIGWVDKKFIIFTLPKTYIINQLEKENKNLQNKIQQLQQNTGSLQSKLSSKKQNYVQTKNTLETSLKTAIDEKSRTADLLSKTQNKYDILVQQSQNIQKIIKENKIFKKENKNLSSDLMILKEKNQNIFKTGMIKWFLAGGGVLLLGWVIGRSVSSKKQQSSSLLS
jgi:SH3 domain protein